MPIQHTPIFLTSSPYSCGAQHGERLLLGTEGGKVILYCTSTLTVLWESVVHEERVTALALSATVAFSASIADSCKLTGKACVCAPWGPVVIC